MQKLIILLDLDDVLNNQNELWIEVLNRRYRYPVRYEDIIDWDMTRFFPRLSTRQLYGPVVSGELVDRMSTTEMSVEYTWSWYSAGHNLMITTSTSTQSIDKKVQWLYKNFKWFHEKNLIVTRHKQLLRGDVLIDDGLHNLAKDEDIDVYPVYTKICLDRPWNQKLEILEDGVHKVYSFKEADDIIQQLAKGKGTFY